MSPYFWKGAKIMKRKLRAHPKPVFSAVRSKFIDDLKTCWKEETDSKRVEGYEWTSKKQKTEKKESKRA